MTGTPAPEQLPERQLNELLRRADWRFLLRTVETPWIADMTSGRDSQAIELIAAEGEPPAGEADVATIGYPSRLALRSALAPCIPAARSSASGACRGRSAAAAPQRACARPASPTCASSGPGRFPSARPSSGSRSTRRRRAPTCSRSARPGPPCSGCCGRSGGPCARAGLLAPLCAIGRVPGGEGDRTPDEIEAAFPAERRPAAPDRRASQHQQGRRPALRRRRRRAAGGRQVRSGRRPPTRRSHARRRPCA